MKKSYDLPEIKELFLLQYYISHQKITLPEFEKNLTIYDLLQIYLHQTWHTYTLVYTLKHVCKCDIKLRFHSFN